MSAIDIKQLTKQFKGQQVLHGISLEVNSGEVVAIIGPSGSGKTTLLRSINLLEVPDSGIIRVGDIEIDGSIPISKQQRQVRALRQQVGFVFQSFNLFPHRSVLENIIEGPVIVKGEKRASAENWSRSSSPRSHSRASCALRSFGVLQFMSGARLSVPGIPRSTDCEVSNRGHPRCARNPRWKQTAR